MNIKVISVGTESVVICIGRRWFRVPARVGHGVRIYDIAVRPARGEKIWDSYVDWYGGRNFHIEPRFHDGTVVGVYSKMPDVDKSRSPANRVLRK